MSRIVARETLMQMVFGLNFNTEIELEEILEVLKDAKLEEEDRQYINLNLAGIKENYSRIINIIKENLRKFTIDRISKTDLAILVVAVYELLAKTESEKVVINEAVELAKAYSDDDFRKMINGVLDKVYHNKEK